MTIADDVRAFMAADNPGFISVGEQVDVGRGLVLSRDDVGLACARWFHSLGPEETPSSAVAYAFVAGVMS